MSRFNIAVEVALGADPAVQAGGWAWTDATPYVRRSMTEAVTIQRGRTGNSSSASPQTLACTVDNRDGRWTARNPVGAWYGQIRRGTPIRVLVGDELTVAADAFTRTVVDGLGSADTGGAYTLTGAGGVVADANFDVTGSSATVAVPVASAYRLAYLADVAEVDQTAYLEMTVPAPTGGNLEPGCLMLRGQSSSEYYNCRVHITTGLAVKVQIDHAGGSTLVAETTVSGLTHAAATPLKVRAQCYGSTVRMRVWQGSSEPSVWHAEAVDPDPIDQPGWVGIRTGRAAGNTNSGVTATYDNFQVTTPAAEFEGFIDSIPKVWDKSLNDCVAPLTAAGYLRRLAKSARPLRSAMYRALTSAGYSQPVAYWPMEDGSTATTFASATGGQPMAFIGMTPAAYSGCAGSGSLPSLSATALASGTVLQQNVFGIGTQWAVRFVVYLPSTPASDVYPLGWYTTGSLTWRVVITALGQIRVEAFDSTYTEKLSASLLTYTAGSAVMVGVDAVQGGSDINWTISYYPGLSTSGTVVGQTTGLVSTVRIGDSAGLAGGSVGHVAVYRGTSPPPVSAAVAGWAGTTVASRIGGLADDAEIPIRITEGTPTTLMGPQSQTSILALIQDAEKADLGLLSESGFGLRYMSRWERYNRTVDLALDFTQGHVDAFAPVDDGQNTVNDIEVSRPRGSTYRYVDEDHVALYDRDDASETINVYADSDLPFQAQWRVWQGTVDEDRLPALYLNFARAPGILDAWRQRVVGSRMTIDNPPSEFGADQVDVHVEGWQQTITPDTWTAKVYTSPARPWQVWDADHGWDLDTAGSTTMAAIDPTQFFADGFEAGVSAWASQNGWALAADSTHVRSGAIAMKLTPPGAVASGGAILNGRTPVTAGLTYVAEAWFWSAAGWSDARVAVDWRNAADGVISSSLGSATVVPAGVWTVSQQVFTAPVGAVTAQLRARQGGTPAGADVLWVDDVSFVPQISVATPSGPLWDTGVTHDIDIEGEHCRATVAGTSSPQTFTLTLGINGVVKSHASGVAVSLWRPRVPAL